MANIVIDGKDIHLHERPKHSAVMAVQNLMTDWMLRNIDMEKLNLKESDGIETALQRAMIGDPEIVQKVATMQQTIELDQTIILSTQMTLKELEELKENIFEDDYLKLYEASKDTMGGTANDFFGAYATDSSSTKTEKMEERILELMELLNMMKTQMENLESQNRSLLETSENQPSGSLQTSTKPSTVEMSTTQD